MKHSSATTPDAMRIPAQLRQQGLVRFDFLGDCLPGNAAPSDIDQVIERNGHFLVIECKRPNQSIGRGQQILFEQLLNLGRGRVRVLVVVGTPPHEIESYAWWGQPPTSADVHEIRALVRRWYEWANTQRKSA